MWTFMQASDAGEVSREAWWSLQTGFYTRRLRVRMQIELRFFAFATYNSDLI